MLIFVNSENFVKNLNGVSKLNKVILLWHFARLLSVGLFWRAQ